MKKNNRGFMLAETLLVTTFVAGILIYLYVQFSNLNTKYNEAYTYNTVENMYALVDVIDLIEDDLNALEYIEKNVVEEKYIDISNCSLFTNSDVCKKLLSIENIDEIFITTNIVPKADITSYTKGLNKFTSKINSSGEQPYRLVASFKDDTYATVRFGNGEIDLASARPKGATYLRNMHVVANYDMSNHNGDSLLDITSNNHNGTVNSGTWGDGFLLFNGTSTWVNLGEINSGTVTMQVTFEPSTIGTYQYLIGNWEGGGGGLLLNSYGYIVGELYIGDGYYSVTSKNIIKTGNKYNATITYDGYLIKLYVNGSLEDITRVAGTISEPLSNTSVALGVNPRGTAAVDGYYFTGKIYNAAIHDVAISSDQVAIDYDTTGLYLEKDTYIIDNFSNWELLNATKDANNVLTMNGGNPAVRSDYYDVNGGFWYFKFDTYGSSTTSYCNGGTGVNFVTYYYDSESQPSTTIGNDENNGWGGCGPIDTWNVFTWEGYTSKYSSRAAINARYGPNVKYVRAQFNVGTSGSNVYSEAPTKIRNFELHGDSIVNSFYDIKVTTTGNKSISTIKYAAGEKTINYFKSNGSLVSNNSIRVTQNGVYTVYLKDSDENEIIKTITITNIG